MNLIFAPTQKRIRSTKKVLRWGFIGICVLVLGMSTTFAAGVGPYPAGVGSKSVGDQFLISDFNSVLDVTRRMFVDENGVGVDDDLVGIGSFVDPVLGVCPVGTQHLDIDDSGATPDNGECFRGVSILDGDLGLGTGAPDERLHLSGAMILGAHEASPENAGTIEWDGTNFRVYNGTEWINIDQGDINANNIALNAAVIQTNATDIAALQAAEGAGITSADIVNWNAAFGWGDHSAAGYLLTSATTTWDQDGTDDLVLADFSASGSGLSYNNLTGEFAFDDTAITANATAILGKADLIVPAAVGNLAGLDGGGNLTDSGLALNDAGSTVTDLWSGSQIASEISSAVSAVSSSSLSDGGVDGVTVTNNAGAIQANMLGGMTINRTAVADVNYSAVADDYVIAFTALTASRTVTLPDGVCEEGRLYNIKDESGLAESFNIVIDPEGATTIDGVATFVMASGYNSIEVYCNGSNWFIK